ncbi:MULTISPECIES: NAD(P)H-binding protein [Amycolatopsis]|uniref:NAD(P)H-binding protein n=1 Tax=Amycolatopsis thermalba TaxID=944492 RepID=A0ABY4P1A2_9PSEU|nr:MULTISPECIES: NAD(P)H-binding protein [Amycolatopsis]OXM67090.1 NmrA family transcriptional regulator [Amycolatopsis sp. KNN50.9b]UQS26119.1 NAD(P)H-binding protein [Amycolatopsis thermalba]
MIVITAPAGRIGRQLTESLLTAGAPVRVIVRDPSRLAPAVREKAEVVIGSHGDPEVVGKAFAGADAVFWLVPPNPAADSLDRAFLDFTRPACELFRTQDLRVVGVSALGRGVAVNAGLVSASLAMDDLIASTGVPYRALTMPTFMDNVLWQAASITRDGVWSEMAVPGHKRPLCATKDIAGAAARLLLDETWTGRGEVPVLGPEDLSHLEMAGIMSDVLGRPVRFEQVTAEALKAGLRQRGWTEAMAQGMADMMAAKNAGLDNAEPRTPESTTPTTFRQWCEENLRPAA